MGWNLTLVVWSLCVLISEKETTLLHLLKSYSQSPGPKLRIAIWIGTKGFNYDATLEYMDYLETLDIPYQSFVAPGVGHNPFALYEKIGIGLMNFHAEAFEQAE